MSSSCHKTLEELVTCLKKSDCMQVPLPHASVLCRSRQQTSYSQVRLQALRRMCSGCPNRQYSTLRVPPAARYRRRARTSTCVRRRSPPAPACAQRTTSASAGRLTTAIASLATGTSSRQRRCGATPERCLRCPRTTCCAACAGRGRPAPQALCGAAAGRRPCARACTRPASAPGARLMAAPRGGPALPRRPARRPTSVQAPAVSAALAPPPLLARVSRTPRTPRSRASQGRRARAKREQGASGPSCCPDARPALRVRAAPRRLCRRRWSRGPTGGRRKRPQARARLARCQSATWPWRRGGRLPAGLA